jgi:hypothetical protein
MTTTQWVDCCDLPNGRHTPACPSRARTIDGVPVTPGLRVIDYNMDAGAVAFIDHVSFAHSSDPEPTVVWFKIRLDKGGWSTMDGLRLWTKVRVKDGILDAAEVQS